MNKDNLSHIKRHTGWLLHFALLPFLMMSPLMAFSDDYSPLSQGNTMQTEIAKVNEASQLITNGENLKPDAASLPFEAPYPFTAQELWQKILKVVELPEGYVTRQQVESIFDVRLQKLEFPKDNINYRPYPIYMATRGGNWYFDLGISESSPGQSHFALGWGESRQRHPWFRPYDSSPLPPHGMCLLPDQLMRDVEQRGWIFKPGPDYWHYSPAVYSKNYIKGKRGVLSLVFFRQDHCLESVVISTTSDRTE